MSSLLGPFIAVEKSLAQTMMSATFVSSQSQLPRQSPQLWQRIYKGGEKDGGARASITLVPATPLAPWAARILLVAFPPTDIHLTYSWQFVRSGLDGTIDSPTEKQANVMPMATVFGYNIVAATAVIPTPDLAADYIHCTGRL